MNVKASLAVCLVSSMILACGKSHKSQNNNPQPEPTLLTPVDPVPTKEEAPKDFSLTSEMGLVECEALDASLIGNCRLKGGQDSLILATASTEGQWHRYAVEISCQHSGNAPMPLFLQAEKDATPVQVKCGKGAVSTHVVYGRENLRLSSNANVLAKAYRFSKPGLVVEVVGQVIVDLQ